MAKRIFSIQASKPAMTAAFENRFIPASHDVDSLSPRVMNRADHYTTYVRWSGEDACWIGCCPDLFIGGMCNEITGRPAYCFKCKMLIISILCI
jgi:hypothetical protein